MAKLMEFNGKTIVMADQDVIGDYDDIAREFLPEVFGIELDECLITDESQLSDFSVGCAPEDYVRDTSLSRQESLKHLYDMCDAIAVKVIKKKYDIDVNAYDSLISVFEKIRQSRNITLN